MLTQCAFNWRVSVCGYGGDQSKTATILLLIKLVTCPRVYLKLILVSFIRFQSSKNTEMKTHESTQLKGSILRSYPVDFRELRKNGKVATRASVHVITSSWNHFFFNSKIRLSYALVSFPKERTSFRRDSTHMQVNVITNIRNKIKRIFVDVLAFFHRKIPVMKSCYSNVAGLKPVTLPQ